MTVPSKMLSVLVVLWQPYVLHPYPAVPVVRSARSGFGVATSTSIALGVGPGSASIVSTMAAMEARLVRSTTNRYDVAPVSTTGLPPWLRPVVEGSHAAAEVVEGEAAAEAAQRDIERGIWSDIEKLRDLLEETIESAANETIFVGKGANRLPNTSCFAVPGWKGETQVMQMDLAGYAISAGSACSSGKVKASAVLQAMGYDATTASSVIRVSLGPQTTEQEVIGFAKAWLAQWQKFRARAA